jgi:hypothetical protein
MSGFRSWASPTTRRAVAAALLAAAAAGVLWVRSPRAEPGDLCSYRAAGALAREGRSAAAYDGAELAAMHRRQHDVERRVGGFLYSPLWLAPAGALAALPLDAAERANRVAGVLALAAGLALVLYRVATPALRVAVAAAFCLSHAGWVQLIYGNWTFLLFLALAAALAAGERGRGLVAALAWGLAIHLKVFAALALAPLAATRAWRRVVAALLAVAALAALGLAWSGPDAWQAWAGSVAGVAERGVTPYYNKVSLAAAAARFLAEPRAWLAPRSPVDAPWIRALALAGLPLLAWGTLRLRRAPERLAAFGIAWALLFVPQIWDHTEILLFLVLPALAARWAWALTALLAGTFFYNGAIQDLLGRTLAGQLSPLALRCLLLLYPAFALLALATTLVEPADGGRPAADA